MAHTQADVIASRVALAKAIHREIAIHQGYISVLRNALSGMNMVAAIEQPVPLAEEHIPAVKGFVNRLTDKYASRERNHPVRNQLGPNYPCFDTAEEADAGSIINGGPGVPVIKPEGKR